MRARSGVTARPRRGVAMIAALWLVVAIAVVALQFSLEAKEGRVLGEATSERGVGRAEALGALSLVQAKLDYLVQNRATGGNSGSALASSDPWWGVDSVFTGTVYVDSVPVTVQARDLGEKLNLNALTQDQLNTLFGYVLGDYTQSNQIAQCIIDWEAPAGNLPPNPGCGRDDYIKKEMLVLPANGPFRDVSELRHVMGMTPGIYAMVEPYLTTRGTGVVNLNSAPIPVLRVLPGMTDAIINQIIYLRSQGRRITSVAEVMSAVQGRRQATAAQANLSNATTTAIGARAGVNTNQVELTIIARAGPQAMPARLTAIVDRTNTTTTVTLRQW